MEENFIAFFAEHIRIRALERENINAHYPDERNAQTVAGLKELATYVESLDPEDRSIAVIGGLWEAQAHDESIGPAFEDELKRFRFNDADTKCDDFLKYLPQILMDEFQNFWDNGV